MAAAAQSGGWQLIVQMGEHEILLAGGIPALLLLCLFVLAFLAGIILWMTTAVRILWYIWEGQKRRERHIRRVTRQKSRKIPHLKEEQRRERRRAERWLEEEEGTQDNEPPKPTEDRETQVPPKSRPPVYTIERPTEQRRDPQAEKKNSERMESNQIACPFGRAQEILDYQNPNHQKMPPLSGNPHRFLKEDERQLELLRRYGETKCRYQFCVSLDSDSRNPYFLLIQDQVYLNPFRFQPGVAIAEIFLEEYQMEAVYVLERTEGTKHAYQVLRCEPAEVIQAEERLECVKKGRLWLR